MRKTTPSSFTRVFLITLLLTGASIATSLPLGETEAFVEKKGLKHNIEKDAKKNYQEMYKKYDFEKYLSNQYEIYKEYTQYYEDLLYDAENPEKNQFFKHKNVIGQDDDRKQKHSDRDGDDNDDYNDANGKSSTFESNDGMDLVTKDKIYTSDKSEEEEEEEEEKKTYKNIKIIECSNLNLNNYDVENYSDIEKILNAKEAKDWSVVKEILNKETISENNDDDYDADNHKESHIKSSNAPQEYNIGSETKLIFLCTNDNINRQPTNDDDGNDMTRSLPDEGIMLPISAHTKNYNNKVNDITTAPPIVS
jgi:hypothetical protein